MMEVKPLTIDGHPYVSIVVQLPYTTLLIITNEIGYVMCGALDVDVLNDKLRDRPVVAGRAVGVKTIDDLLNGKLEKVTHTANKQYGWKKGMPIREALLLISEKKE
ncbi:YunC family protein [Gracilibacillus marinus]|jgi:uncharacterized protein YunC (DUF1805 family)|uniref:YunC family protein n=1 Tax=Gracilibacillus marinus TaxID=630535 RepID=A0ABV8VWI0_9BACI